MPIRPKLGLFLFSSFILYKTLFFFACACQGFDGAPSIDVMLLKSQFFTASGTSQRHEQGFQYLPLMQFLPLKLAVWVAKNLADELSLPHSSDECSFADMNHILTHCLLSEKWGNNVHTFHCVEFESDLY